MTTMGLFKSKSKSLKPTICRQHHSDLVIVTSNSVNKTPRERHARLLGGEGRRRLPKINRK